MRKTTPAVAAIAALTLAACSSAANPAASTTTGTAATTTVVPTPSTAPTTTSPTTVAVAGEALPISFSNQLASNQQDSSVLVPSSCELHGGVVTAQGTVTGVLPEVYIRYGDVVELYAYNTAENSPNSISAIQVLDLESEHPGNLIRDIRWTASAPVANGFPQPMHCFVAIQSTHAFMGAGNAGG